MQNYSAKLTAIIFFTFLSFIRISAQVNFLEVSIEELIEKAKQEKKPVFIFLSDNKNESFWMEHNVFNDPAIGELYERNFVCGIFYGQINYTNLSTDKLKITKYPYFLYYEPTLQSGYRASGGLTKEKIYDYGKAMANEFKLLNAVHQQINPIDSNTRETSYQILDNDGRYTLGVEGSRLMYGYPYPNSTSHFVINAGGKMASNSPRFLITSDIEFSDYLEKKSFFDKIFGIFKKKKEKTKLKSYSNVKYLSDTLLIRFDENNSMHSTIDYRFNGLKITQKLSPLNSKLEACKANDSTRYYQVDYIIENDSNISIKAGILVLFDMMIDNNDAAQMDAFSTDLAIKTRPELTNKNTKLRGKYAKYTNVDHINRILVYRDTKTTKSLTGDFHLSSEPDEIHIGSWPILFSVLWDVPKIKVGTKYFDSAVLLKWDTIALESGSKRTYTSTFGLYNKGVLELVPAGTNFTGTTKTGSRVKLGKPDFTVSPDTIYEGQTALLKWNVDNPLVADIYVSAKSKTKQRNQGKMSISPKSTTIYYLQLIDHGKEIANVNTRVVVLKKPAEIIPEKINFDGKFTIGSDNKPITYGYPFPYSTSYFQLNYKKEYFSNNSSLDKTKYLEGMQNLNMAKEKRNVVTYKSTDFEIIQRLIPLDEKYEITEPAMALYFRCEYCVKNLKNAKSYFGFKQILDFSSFDADKLQLQVNEKPAKFNITYTDANIPDLLVLSDKHDNNGIKLFTTVKGGEKPKSVSVGDWHFLKNLKLEINYSDSSFYKNPAALISWQKSILPYDSAKFVFIIGTNQNQKLQYLYNQSEEIKSMSINFETSQYKVPEDKINEIINFVKDSTFDFMVLEGFSDNRGKLETNYLLSKKRINNIMEIITHKTDIKKNQILNQVHGEFFSNQKSNNLEVDDKEERKVKIVLFRVLK